MCENTWKRIYQNISCDYFGGQEIIKRNIKKETLIFFISELYFNELPLLLLSQSNTQNSQVL